MRRTKIIATVGPSTDDIGLLKNIMGAGIDAFRLNFSHGTHDEWSERIGLLKRACEESGIRIPMILDTKGPEIRTGYVEGYEDDNKTTIILSKDSIIEIIGDEHNSSIEGEKSSSTRIFVSYPEFSSAVSIDGKILIDDGHIMLTVTGIENNKVYARVENTGYLGSRKGVNIPGARLNFPTLNDKDKDDILFGIMNGIDYVAISFVRRADDIIAVRKLLEENNGNGIKVIAKIENKEGCDNIEEIISLCDGVMIARGDLGVEMPYYEVPVIQDMVIDQALKEGKIVITATHMLNSMIHNPIPTRAEVSDVYSSVKGSSTCIMLSGETANGSYPLESVNAMVSIATTAEDLIDYESYLRRPFVSFKGHIAPAVSFAAVSTSYRINAKAIVAYTESGSTARHLSMFRPRNPIIAVSPNERVVRQMRLLWGVTPVHDNEYRDIEGLFSHAEEFSRDIVGLVEGDKIIVVAGTNIGVSGSTNALRIITIGNVIARGVSLSKGVVEGTVKVCRDINEAESKISVGDICVFYNFDNEYVKFLDRVKGIIIPAGAYETSAVREAREKNIPVIADVHDVAKRINDNMRVRMNGDRGFIVLL